MGKHEKILRRILGGRADANIDFHDLRNLLAHLGFQVRVRGSHHLFYRKDIEEFLNLQQIQGKTKPYQIRQTRNFLIRHGLGLEE